jgi:hypothetical protein
MRLIYLLPTGNQAPHALWPQAEAINFPAEDLFGGFQRLGLIPYFWGFLR